MTMMKIKIGDVVHEDYPCKETTYLGLTQEQYVIRNAVKYGLYPSDVDALFNRLRRERRGTPYHLSVDIDR